MLDCFSKIDIENNAVNPHANDDNIITIRKLLYQTLSRRNFVIMGTTCSLLPLVNCSSKGIVDTTKTEFDFTEISMGVDEDIHIPEGYVASILLRWGDKIVKNAPDFDVYAQTPEAQEMQFGYNNDYIGFAPLPMNAKNPKRALLCINHEYALAEMMFPENERASYSKHHADIMMAAQGNTIVEIKRNKDMTWSVVQESDFNRRITLRSTPIKIVGTARGAKRMQTKDDPKGETVIGTFQNCAGGMTPWGTYLTCEENINYGFHNLENLDKNNPETKKIMRFGIDKGEQYCTFFDRFDLVKEPNEINRFGWVVEIDPYDPTSIPRKLTSLGRFKHEACTVIIAHNQHIVAYMADDQYFEYLYKFISKHPFIQDNRSHNMRLLEEGTLYVAKFHEDNIVEWLPLVHGEYGLTSENGFASQADIMIDTRLAADKVGATPLDRPEDVEIHPKTGAVYVSLTMNEERIFTDAVNPRILNEHGHIIELITQDDHISNHCRWDILLLGGTTSQGGTPHPKTSEHGIISCPDNLAFDKEGRLWVATDQGKRWHEKTGHSDGVYGLETQGSNRGYSKLFFRCPVGAETTGLCFTDDTKTLFLSVQHPAYDGAEGWNKFAQKSHFDNPASHWPDFNEKMPPRPAIVQITRKGQKI